MESSVTPAAADGVRVCVRVRPLNAREKAAIAESKTSWAINDSSITQLIGEKPIAANSFSFDNVFEQHVTNSQIFTALAEPVVVSATEGINGTIFAYGQTAAGKTYTMLGTPHDPGVTRRSIAAVFDIISKASNRQFLLRASYIEIYNEVIRDLLVPDNDNLKIHEDVVTKRVFVDSMEEVVTSVDQVMGIIAKGETARAVGVTNMNDRSSRSHTIFSLKIESREMSAAEVEGQQFSHDGVAVRASTLSLVDLAGSERASFTKAQGMRLVEGGHINKSLLTLGTVINKLSSGEQQSSLHIPYRDSKLTRLLQPALGGNARTAIVCAITPAILHMEETLSTLKFASRAKKVTNSAKTNEFLDDRAKLRRAEKEIAQLKSECSRLKSGQGVGIRAGVLKSESNSSLQERALAQTSNDRVRAFEDKFQILLNISREDIPSAKLKLTSKTRRRKRTFQDMSEPSLANALHLFSSEEVLGADESVEGPSEAILTSLRRKLLEAEKQMRQDQSAINYERQAMMAEVEELVLSTDQADYARKIAEKDSAEAVAELGRAQVKSLVDEIVSGAMSISLCSQGLRESRNKLAKLETVNAQNVKLKDSLTTLQKEHSEIVRREKRGIGPVLKEVKFLQGKLTDVENKARALREKSNRTAAEKASVEREMKKLQRQNKVLTNEIEKHRNHISKGQERLSRDIGEERKKFETATNGMKEELTMLSDTLREREDELSSTLKQLGQVEQALEEVKLVQAGLAEELETKRKQLEASQNELKRLESSSSTQRDEVAVLTDEVGRAHLELDETKLELSKVLAMSKQFESDILQVKGAHKVSLQEGEKAADDLKIQISCERAAKEIALAELSKTNKTIEEQDNLISAKEQYIQEMKLVHEAEQAVLIRERETIEKLQVQILNLQEKEKVLTATNDAKNIECAGLRDRLLDSSRQRRPRQSTESQHLATTEMAVSNERDGHELHEYIEKLVGENAIRAREVLKLSEAIQRRDRQIYDLEDTIDQLGRGEGVIAVQERRLQRRDVVIKDLNSRLKTLSKLLEDNSKSAALLGAERLIQLEARIASLVEERRQLEERLSRFEVERPAMIAEARKLREKIKERDSQRVKEAVMRKEKQYEEVKRRNQSLRELPLNTATQ